MNRRKDFSVGQELLLVNRYGRSEREPVIRTVTIEKVGTKLLHVRMPHGGVHQYRISDGGSEESWDGTVYTEQGWADHQRRGELITELRAFGLSTIYGRVLHELSVDALARIVDIIKTDTKGTP